MVEVVPLAGTWIEILDLWYYLNNGNASFPSRERGLKYRIYEYMRLQVRRSPRGNVD